MLFNLIISASVSHVRKFEISHVRKFEISHEKIHCQLQLRLWCVKCKKKKIKCNERYIYLACLQCPVFQIPHPTNASLQSNPYQCLPPIKPLLTPPSNQTPTNASLQSNSY